MKTYKITFRALGEPNSPYRTITLKANDMEEAEYFAYMETEETDKIVKVEEV